MICALTVRKLKPGTFDEFREAFTADFTAGPPPGWVRFNMLRGVADPDEVVCFGFYDGTVEQLHAGDFDQDPQQERIAAFVESVGADQLFEIAVELTASG